MALNDRKILVAVKRSHPGQNIPFGEKPVFGRFTTENRQLYPKGVIEQRKGLFSHSQISHKFLSDLSSYSPEHVFCGKWHSQCYFFINIQPTFNKLFTFHKIKEITSHTLKDITLERNMRMPQCVNRIRLVT